MQLNDVSAGELQDALAKIQQQHQRFIDEKLNLDLTRGKPSSAQLDLSNDLLTNLQADDVTQTTDLRNYGLLAGLPQAQTLFGSLLGLPEAQSQQRVFVGGNSSLTLMHYAVWFAYNLGITPTATPWKTEEQQSGKKTKILCPCPGYDRHFSICEELDIEMVPVALTGNGPDMDQVEALVRNDPSIKGIWCIPRFSNPTGEVYSNKTVERLSKLVHSAGENFYLLWDNAYAVHSLEASAAQLANINDYSKIEGTDSSIIQFGSTSKITFAGAGIGYIVSSEENISGFTRHFGKASIGSDKLNQLRHVKFLKDRETTAQHMAKHAEIIQPKFVLVEKILTEHLGQSDMGYWSCPKGGYFVSFNTQPGLAKKVIALAGEAGVKLTPAGSTFPYQLDSHDQNIRLAPTYPELADVEKAMRVFVNCVKLASFEKILAEEVIN